MNKRFYREFALLLRHFHLINIESAFIWWGCQVGNEKVNKSRLLSFMTMSQYSPFFSNHLLIFTNSITATDQGWGSKKPMRTLSLIGTIADVVICRLFGAISVDHLCIHPSDKQPVVVDKEWYKGTKSSKDNGLWLPLATIYVMANSWTVEMMDKNYREDMVLYCFNQFVCTNGN